MSTITFAQTGTTRMITAKIWDILNRLTSINSKTNSVAVTTANYLYNSANQRTKCNTVDGSYWVYGYDSLGQVTGAHKFWVDGTPVAGQQFDYTFDDIGNRKCAWEGGNGAGEVERRADYTVNLLNQYTQRTVPGAVDIIGSANSNATVTVNNQPTQRHGDYYWDQFPVTNGVNPVWVSVTNFAVLNNGSNPDIVTTNIGFLFAPKTPEAFTYDDDGNLLSDGRWNYTWDAENRLMTMAAASTTAGRKERLAFEYDWQGRRIHKQAWTNWDGASGTLVLDQKYVYDGWNLIAAITTQPSSTVQTYAWGLDLSGGEQGAGGVGGLLMANFGASGTNFVSFDGNGNVLALVDAITGTNSALYEYDPFGKVLRATGPLAKTNPFRFSTKFTDDETDLVYYGYRYYNPSIGRWINRDPSGEAGGLNLWSFCNNEPIGRNDVLGHYSTDLIPPGSKSFNVDGFQAFVRWDYMQGCGRLNFTTAGDGGFWDTLESGKFVMEGDWLGVAAAGWASYNGPISAQLLFGANLVLNQDYTGTSRLYARWAFTSTASPLPLKVRLVSNAEASGVLMVTQQGEYCAAAVALQLRMNNRLRFVIPKVSGVGAAVRKGCCKDVVLRGDMFGPAGGAMWEAFQNMKFRAYVLGIIPVPL